MPLTTRVSIVYFTTDLVTDTLVLNDNILICFYSGRCNRGDKCTFIHDPKRVAVCNK